LAFIKIRHDAIEICRVNLQCGRGSQSHKINLSANFIQFD
jgi:hypothetical protein